MVAKAKFLEPQPIALLLGAARRAIKKVVWQRFSDHGLTPPQVGALLALAEGEGEGCRLLARRLFMDEPTFTRLLDRLERAGLCRRSKDTADRRRACIGLTALGRQKARAVGQVARRLEREIERGLSPAEVETLRTLLQRLIASVEEQGRRSPEGKP
jgi:DNA-binding MarR family transcriptional regulator